MSRSPRLARILIRVFASRGRNESYLGDIEEMYADGISSGGGRRFRLWFWREIFNSLPAYVKDIFTWSFRMFKNYVKTAFRALQRKPGYALLNIAGLAVGIASVLFIWLWVQDELGFDRFHRNSESLFRLQRENGNASSPYPFGPALKAEIPEFAAVTRIGNPGILLVQAGERSFYESSLRAVDPDFLSMFTFPLVEGLASAALSGPQSVVISWDMAKKYFPEEDPMGRTLLVNKEYALTVSGVMKNPPANSTLRPHFLVPLDRMEDLRATKNYWKNINRWDLGAFQTWVELHDPASASRLGPKVTALYDSHTKWNPASWKLEALTALHFSEARSSIYLFSGLALFILVVACINFMNLATARAAGRAREVGLRKVVGAGRRNIAAQFYGETFVTTFLAVLAAAGIFLLLFPTFQRISGKAIGLGAIGNWKFGLGLLATVFLTGILAGSYPALLLSSLRPVKTLKGQWRSGARSASFRKILVVFQFALSAVLLIGTGIIYRQVNHVRTMNPGYDKDNIITVSLREDTAKTYPVLKAELRGEDLVPGVTASFQLPMDNGMRETGTRWEGIDLKSKPYAFYDAVDYDYAETLGLELAAGRTFGRAFPADAAGAFLVNVRMTQQMGLASPGEALGKTIKSWGVTGPIVGVVKDYHFQSAESVIEPQVISLGQDKLSYAVFRLKGGRIPDALARVNAAWTRVNPGHPFEYRFFDEAFDAMVRADRQLGAILLLFSAMGVLIACLGLFGLASFTAAQRTKEIGIRKVLGASTPGILLLLGKEFFVWVAFANLLAWPAAYWVTNNWLDKFAYRAAFGWWIFPAVGAGTLILALATVGAKSFRTALSKTSTALRYE